MPGWSELDPLTRRERVALCLECGMRAMAICAHLGMSAGAVAGVRRRMGLSGGPREAPEGREGVKPIRRGHRKVADPKVKPPPRTTPMPTLRTVAADGGKGVAALELEDGMCPWPISRDKPWRFCGCATNDGGRYCGDHARLSCPRPGAGNDDDDEQIAA